MNYSITCELLICDTDLLAMLSLLVIAFTLYIAWLAERKAETSQREGRARREREDHSRPTPPRLNNV